MIQNKHLKQFGLLITGVLSTLCTHSQVNFTPLTKTATGSAPTVVCVGDVNNDGLYDIVLCTGYGVSPEPKADNKTFVFLQNSVGKLASPIVYPNTSFSPFAIEINDLNNDALNDVLIAYDDSVGIFYQNKQGTLDPIKSYFSGYFGQVDGISTGDLNSDGLNDIAISHSNSPFINVLYRNLLGGFTSYTYASPNASNDHVIKIADINNDKRDDIVLSMNEGIYIYTQSLTGSLNKYVEIKNGNSTIPSKGMAIGDLHGDGFPDIVQTLSDNSPGSAIQFYNQNTNTHTIDKPTSIATYKYPEAIKVANLNCDSHNEIIVLHGLSQIMTVYEQSANVYSSYKSFALGNANHYNSYGVSVGDFNNDGLNDIAIADYKDGLITMYNAGNCSNTCSKFVKPKTPVGISAICKNTTKTTYTSIHTAGDKLFWNLYPSNAGTIVYADNDSCNITWNDSWYGKASISVKAYNACGSGAAQPLIITVHVPPINIGKDTAVCSKKTLQLKATSGFDSYVWSTKSTDSIISVISPATVFVEAHNVCGTAYDTIIIASSPYPKKHLPTDTIMCVNKPMFFDLSMPGATYQWQDASTEPKMTVTEAGIYSVIVTDSYSCNYRMDATVTLKALPSIQLPNDTTVCNTLSLPIAVSCATCSYEWNTGSKTNSITASSAGIYSVSATNSCGLDRDTIVLAISKSPEIKLSHDTTICTGKSLLCDVTLPGKNTYLWQDKTTNPKYSISRAGTYSVSVTNSFHCSASKSVKVKEMTVPSVTLPNDTTVCDSILLTLDVSCNQCTYKWSNDSTKPTFIINDFDIYTVNVSNRCGNTEKSFKVSKAECSAVLDVPTAFSPNNDGLNDVLYAIARNVQDIELNIFNRWGQKIFTSTNVKEGWDGTRNGKAMDDGVYMFSITATKTADGSKVEKSGNITLLR